MVKALGRTGMFHTCPLSRLSRFHCSIYRILQSQTKNTKFGTKIWKQVTQPLSPSCSYANSKPTQALLQQVNKGIELCGSCSQGRFHSANVFINVCLFIFVAYCSKSRTTQYFPTLFCQQAYIFLDINADEIYSWIANGRVAHWRAVFFRFHVVTISLYSQILMFPMSLGSPSMPWIQMVILWITSLREDMDLISSMSTWISWRHWRVSLCRTCGHMTS